LFTVHKRTGPDEQLAPPTVEHVERPEREDAYLRIVDLRTSEVLIVLRGKEKGLNF